jgi:hypothetical protein
MAYSQSEVLVAFDRALRAAELVDCPASHPDVRGVRISSTDWRTCTGG